VRRVAASLFAVVLVGGGAGDARAGGIDVRLAVVRGSVWATTGSAVLRIDPRTGRLVARPNVALPYPIDLAANGGAAWVASVANGFVAGALTRIDLRTGRATTGFRVADAAVFAVAATADAVWALAGPSGTARVVRIDPRTGQDVRAFRIARRPACLAADSSGAWVIDQQGLLLHVGARTSRIHAVTRLVNGGGRLAVGRESVWVIDGRDVVRIDKRTRRMRARIGIGDSLVDIAVGERGVWVLRLGSGRTGMLVRVDPETNRITGRARLASSPGTLAVGAGAVWIGTLFPIPRLLRVDPRTMSARTFAPLG
jgi:hypothetical protein